MTAKRLGFYSKEIQLACPDGRTRQGRLLKRVRRELSLALGGEDRVTPIQQTLIDRAAHLQLKVAVMDEQSLAGGLPERTVREYLAASNALVKVLTQLGLGRPIPPKPEPP